MAAIISNYSSKGRRVALTKSFCGDDLRIENKVEQNFRPISKICMRPNFCADKFFEQLPQNCSAFP